jgi:hypothetical protein
MDRPQVQGKPVQHLTETVAGTDASVPAVRAGQMVGPAGFEPCDPSLVSPGRIDQHRPPKVSTSDGRPPLALNDRRCPGRLLSDRYDLRLTTHHLTGRSEFPQHFLVSVA